MAVRWPYGGRTVAIDFLYTFVKGEATMPREIIRVIKIAFLALRNLYQISMATVRPPYGHRTATVRPSYGHRYLLELAHHCSIAGFHLNQSMLALALCILADDPR